MRRGLGQEGYFGHETDDQMKVGSNERQSIIVEEWINFFYRRRNKN